MFFFDPVDAYGIRRRFRFMMMVDIGSRNNCAEITATSMNLKNGRHICSEQKSYIHFDSQRDGVKDNFPRESRDSYPSEIGAKFYKVWMAWEYTIDVQKMKVHIHTDIKWNENAYLSTKNAPKRFYISSGHVGES